MKNVIIISSSPRKKGNSDLLCDEFLKGAKSAGHKVEKIFLKDKKINFCTGCDFCVKKNFTTCSQKDDMKEILEKMISADVIVFATPIYFYTISGQLKTLIDRMSARYAYIKNKEFFYIFTAQEDNKNAIKYALGELKGLMANLEKPKQKGYLFAGGVWHKGEVKNTPFMKKAFEFGKSI